MKSDSQMWIDRILSRKTILLIILFTLFILFCDSIWDYYDQTIVKGFLSKIQSHWLIDITIFLLCVCSFIATIYLIVKCRRITNALFFSCLCLFTLFSYCRFFSGRYIYKSFYWFTSLNYIDSVLFLLGSILVLKIWNWLNAFKKPFYFDSPFYIDYPIKSSSEDVYKRSEFAELLAKKIQSELENKNAGALAIGINGAWGSGKTSFANLVKEKIKPENRIIIEFNPWRSSSPQKIIEDYFELVISQLQEYDPGLSKEINNYASTLTKIDENIITKSIETIGDYILTSPDKNESYDKINEAILKLRKQIIIFIDDLDRLDMNEIIEVLRLIRNTANFNNVVYLVSYDKNYVLEAVKKFNPFNYKFFLEKIFQFEFLLPGFDNAIIRNDLKSLLGSGLGPDFGPIINASVDYVGYSGRNLTSQVLKNKRDILRFSNSLMFEINGIKEEVNFIDFYLIQLLKLKFTSVYKFIADHFELFFMSEKGIIRLRLISEKDLNDKYVGMLSLLDDSRKAPEKGEEKNTLFEEYIRGNVSEGYNSLEKDTILEIIKQVLIEKNYRVSSSSKDFKSFVYAKNFNKYFNITLLETDFSAKEFEEYRYDDFEKYHDVIFKWINSGRISDVLERLEKIIDFSSKKEWEIHLNLLVKIAKFQYNQGGVYGINYRGIIDVLNYPDKKDRILFFEDRDEYLNYVKEFFKHAPDPYVIESSILTAALTQYATLPLENEEIHRQLADYFINYCGNHPEITDDFRALHLNAVKKKEGYHDEYEYLEGVQELFVSHFLKYLKGSQLAGFIKHTDSRTDLFHCDYDWIKTFFKEPLWDNLEKYLAEAENIKKEKDYYDEFVIFYSLFKSNNYKPIEFVFDFLTPSLWTGGTKSNPSK